MTHLAYQAIPEELKAYMQWVVWRWEERDGKWTKNLYSPRTGRQARSNQPLTWGTFEAALERYVSEDFDGIGFVVTEGDPYCGVDLDNCIDEEGTLAEWADEIVERLDSYTEVTPSGRGVRIWLRAKLPSGGRRKGKIELYETGRFFTVTGAHLDGTPTEILDQQAALEKLHSELFARSHDRKESGRDPVPVSLQDEELLQKAQAASNGSAFSALWGGDWSTYDSQSEADLALCNHLAFWTGGDERRMDDLFRRSGLYRAKWDKTHFASGETYGQSVIAKAIAGTTSYYSTNGHHNGSKQSTSEPAAGVNTLPGLADILAALSALQEPDEPPERKVVEAKARELIEATSYLDAGELLEVTALLEELGVSRTWLTRDWKPAVVKKAKARVAAQQATQPPPPEDAPASWPYKVEAGRIVYMSQRALPEGGFTTVSTPVCDFVAQIKKEIFTETGEKLFVIHGKAIRGGEFTLEVRSDEYADERRLKAALTTAAGARDPVRAGMLKHLGAGIQMLTTNDLEQTTRYTRTGWQGDTFLIPGREEPGTEIHLRREMPYWLDPEAELELGLEGLDALIQAVNPERSTVALANALQAPLAHLAGWRNERYCLFIKGRTGSFKTAFAVLLMCLYGPGFQDESRLIKWGEGATRNSVMAIATHIYDLPLLIDNYKPTTGGGTRDFVNLIHNILEGSEKLRLNRAAELRDSRPIFSWPIATGEDVPDSDPASLARALVVPFEWERGNANQHLTEAQSLAAHLCAVGAEWLAWLETPAGREVARKAAAKFPQYRDKWAEWLRNERPDMVNIMRVASSLASNALAWWAATQHPTIGPLLESYSKAHAAGIRHIAAEMAQATAEALEATRFLSALQELLSTDRVALLPLGTRPKFDSEKDRTIGWKDLDGTIYLNPGMARQAVERLLGHDALGGISQQTLYSQLEGLGVILRTAGDQTTTLKRVDGTKPQRVLTLKPGTLEVGEDKPDSDSAHDRIVF